MSVAAPTVADALRGALPGIELTEQATADAVPTFWIGKERLVEVCRHLKEKAGYRTLYDLSALDERVRRDRDRLPVEDFTIVYHLLKLEPAELVRLKVAIADGEEVPTLTGVWTMANWYEREVWDMFGQRFAGHPNLRRILMPNTWKGHPLRKEHPARATEMEPFSLSDARGEAEQEAMHFSPGDWGMSPGTRDTDFMFLNIGPQHPGTHGVLRVVLQLDGEEIVDLVPEIGFHHRGAEKMGERQTWHTYIPYTDRVDYLVGFLNELPYVQTVERMAGITVPARAQVMRVMLCELYRIANHLVWYGTFAQDLGAMSPVFYTFNDRERFHDIISAVAGARMHPGWFRIGGTAQDLPEGWREMVQAFVKHMEKRIPEYNKVAINRIFRARTKGIGAFTRQQAIEWGATGPQIRATGLAFDWRKARPYSMYDQFEFDIPTAEGGDCWARSMVRIEEMRQSLRIIQQCVDNMPAGEHKSRHPLATPPLKDRTMHDIETLITHFLGVSWGPVIPPSEAMLPVEGAKGLYSYYLTSDGSNQSYRTRIRTASFAHMQILAPISKRYTVADLMAILGATDYVLSDVDR